MTEVCIIEDNYWVKICVEDTVGSVCVCVCACVYALSCVQLCNPMDHSLSGSCVDGISQIRILEWLPFYFRVNLPGPVIEPASLVSPALAGTVFTTDHMGTTYMDVHECLSGSVMSNTMQLYRL